MKSARFIAAFLFAASVAVAQPCTQLTTTFASNNGQSGNMFDIVALNDVTVCSFNVNVDAGAAGDTLEVYTLPQGMGWATDPTNATGTWTLIASVPVTAPAGLNLPTAGNLQLGVNVPAGATQAFYVTLTNTTNINYTNGTTVGALFASDTNIEFYEGSGNAYPFGATFQPRVWNGDIIYCPGLNAACPAAVAPPFQLNSPESSLDFDGVQSNGQSQGTSVRCFGESTSFTAATTLVGNPAEIVYDLGAGVAGPNFPAILTGSGSQVVNVNLTSPFVAYFFGGTAPNFLPHPGVVSLTLTTPAAALTVSAQQVVFDPSNLDGIALSQAGGLEATAGGTAAGPVGDDSFVNLSLLGSPLCGSAPISFYGTSYTDINVVSNGRVMFGAGDVDFSSSVAEALADNPFVGAWTDLNPAAGGTISTSVLPTGEYSVDYNAVPYFGSANTATFSVIFDPATGLVTIDGLAGIVPDTGNMFLGLSGGNIAGATDPGAADYSLTAGVSLNATDMIYEFGTVGSLAPGISQILFIPNGLPNYDWTAL